MKVFSVLVDATLDAASSPMFAACNKKKKTTNTRRATKATVSTRRWWTGREPPSVQALPPLLPRPTVQPPSSKTLQLGQQHNHDRKPHEIINPQRDIQPGEKSDDDDDGSSTATDVLRLMDVLQVPVDVDTYIALLRECTDSRDAVQGAMVHAHIRSSGLLPQPDGILLANRLILMYAASGQPEDARRLFDQMLIKDGISWATMIAALSNNGGHRESLHLFVDMMNKRGAVVGHDPCFLDAVIGILRSCVRVGSLDFGQQIHGLAMKIAGASALTGTYLGSPLIQFYSMLGCQECVRKLFGRISPSLDPAAWTSMIAEYNREGRFDEAISIFREMGRGRAGKKNKNRHVLSSTLAACAGLGDEGWSGRQLHADAVKTGADKDPFVVSSLVNMYGKCGLLGDARRAFEVNAASNNSSRDAVCWSAMFYGLARNGCFAEAVGLVYKMKAAGVEPLNNRMVGESISKF